MRPYRPSWKSATSAWPYKLAHCRQPAYTLYCCNRLRYLSSTFEDPRLIPTTALLPPRVSNIQLCRSQPFSCRIQRDCTRYLVIRGVPVVVYIILLGGVQSLPARFLRNSPKTLPQSDTLDA
ncbi:hypothetical protein M426DRAFT_197206 [Hypoxylon sp. CI-4A]|nr:hypothetical protein M426DRAFT_197206 [Hypoxylon sp. CI-4A]